MRDWHVLFCSGMIVPLTRIAFLFASQVEKFGGVVHEILKASAQAIHRASDVRAMYWTLYCYRLRTSFPFASIPALVIFHPSSKKWFVSSDKSQSWTGRNPHCSLCTGLSLFVLLFATGIFAWFEVCWIMWWMLIKMRLFANGMWSSKTLSSRWNVKSSRRDRFTMIGWEADWSDDRSLGRFLTCLVEEMPDGATRSIPVQYAYLR